MRRCSSDVGEPSRRGLSEDDILDRTNVPGAILRSCRVEAHVTGGVATGWRCGDTLRAVNQVLVPMMAAQRLENTYVAGRRVWLPHQGQSSARVTGPCLVVVQTARNAADVALDAGLSCGDIEATGLLGGLGKDGTCQAAPW
jgi:hypothetical protein